MKSMRSQIRVRGGKTNRNGSGVDDHTLETADLAGDLATIQRAADLEDLLAALAGAVVRSISADACLVSLWDSERDRLVDVAASTTPRFSTMNTVAESFDLGEYPLTKRVLETGRSAEIGLSDKNGDKSEQKFLADFGAARVLISRLTVDGKAMGTIESYRVEDRPFRSDDPRRVELLVTFAANSYSRIQMAVRLEALYTEILEALTSALEARDPYTEAHTGRIRDMTSALAVAMKVPSEERRAVRLGAILHDVGKIGIPDVILSKPGPLDADEWVVMRRHPEIGERMLQSIDFLALARPIIRHHHERWDGGGYPDGLAGEDIPIGARIVAVCDSYDAMTSDRPYRKAMEVDQACRELLAHSGTQFDPDCVSLLIETVMSQDEVGKLEEKLVRYAS